MLITINGTGYRLPASLLEVTLAERIRYDEQYGRPLQEQLAALYKSSEEALTKATTDEERQQVLSARELDLMVHYCAVACKTLSFFGGIPLEIVEQTKAEDVLQLYHLLMLELSEETDFTKLDRLPHDSFAWKNAIWRVAPPQLQHDSSMTFGELIDAKQWMKNIETLGAGRWEALLMLCCVYFRREGEPYTKELSYPDGERYRLLQALPLQYALEVGFFLSSSMTTYLSIFRSFSQAGEKSPASTSGSTMTPTGGSIFLKKSPRPRRLTSRVMDLIRLTVRGQRKPLTS